MKSKMRSIVLLAVNLISLNSLYSQTDRIQSVLADVSEKHSRGVYKSTIPDLKKILNLRPYHDRILIHYAIALMYQENPISEEEYIVDCRKASELLLKVIHLNQANLKAGFTDQLALLYFYRGLSLWFSGQPDQALHEFSLSIKYDPSLFQAVFNQAVILMEMGRMQEFNMKIQEYEGLKLKQVKP
ncbi:MAG: hypothetical protein OEZ34_17295 [Spirochaetia bacterium]|nr:hypothetical protein [Spirochaetia bacterium]